ncbi:hypothetical protein LV85_00315 [Algoriphagus chordae]|uniref:Uncharacterized protein n=1 Tax=Algoriphagus chordae TaxID=237019 RepID=A0A2W7RU22_9BACT|nr:hypothetical protein LV85_00315 [Algoriphagus chordae]
MEFSSEIKEELLVKDKGVGIPKAIKANFSHPLFIDNIIRSETSLSPSCRNLIFI